jgi:hypothetical protein
MSIRTSLVGSAAVLGAVFGIAWTTNAQIPAVPQKPPMRVEMKAKAGTTAAGPFGKLGVVLEIDADQPNVPAGLRGTIVVTNTGTEPVEFLEPRDSSQLELQGADGKSIPVPPVVPGSLVNVQGAKPPAPIRLAPKESHRTQLVVTEVVGEGKAAPQPAPPSPNAGAARSNTVPLFGGAYRVRAHVRVISAQGKPGEARPTASFESGWVDVTFGGRSPK